MFVLTPNKGSAKLRLRKAAQKYTEAVAVAAEKCADDTKGQTCYICTEALHRHTKEGLVRGCSCRGTAGFAHVSCLAEEAKIWFTEAEENNLDWKVKIERWDRWYTCSLCEQEYHGVVKCALGWACWKTYLGRPETDRSPRSAMSLLGSGLSEAEHHEDALSVKEALLAMLRRVGDSEYNVLAMQGNLACTYGELGRLEEALCLREDIYSRRLKLIGVEHRQTLASANNYANSLSELKRFEEAKSVLRKMMPVARRILGESDRITLTMRKIFAEALYLIPDATLDDLREAVATLEEIEQTARRVLGGAHPLVRSLVGSMRLSREAHRAREASNA